MTWISPASDGAKPVSSGGAPPSNTCRLLARDHAAPESTLALSKAHQPCCGRVRPLAWCSRPRNSAASLEGALEPLLADERNEPAGHGADDRRALGAADDHFKSLDATATDWDDQ